MIKKEPDYDEDDETEIHSGLHQEIDHEEELEIETVASPPRKGKKENVKARVEAARMNREKIVKDKIEQAGKFKGKKIKISGKSRGRIPGKLKMDFPRTKHKEKKKEAGTPSPEKKQKKKKVKYPEHNSLCF